MPRSNAYDVPRVRSYTLLILTLVYAVSMIDRQILSILQESIKRDLGLSDSQLGLVSGFAFAIFYVGLGVPLARLADRSVRRNIIACAVATWSLMTAISALTQNFSQLLLARIGVAAGEAGANPAAYSMIADIYPAEKRASAISFFQVGAYVGILFGFLFGGWLNYYLGWRMALIVVGVPGLLLALLVRFTIVEPIRGLSDSLQAKPQQSMTLKQVCLLLWSSKSFRYLTAAGSLGVFSAFTMFAWMAPYMIRVHGMGTGELGTVLALTIGLGGGIGTLLTGALADRLALRDKRWYVWLPVLAMLVSAPAYLAMFSMSNPKIILLINVLPMFLVNVYGVLSYTAIQCLVAPNMRATSMSIFALIASTFGMGFGPWVTGFTSDLLLPVHGVESIRYALLYLIPAITFSSALLYLRAAKYLREDIARVSI